MTEKWRQQKAAREAERKVWQVMRENERRERLRLERTCSGCRQERLYCACDYGDEWTERTR